MYESIIRELLAPVVMISACGLLCLALFNRLATIVARTRQFHHERLDLFRQLRDADDETRSELELRFEQLERQALRIISRAQMVRNALICLVLCIISMLLCSLVIGLSHVWAELAIGTLILFVVGVLSMLVGMVLSLRELGVSLEQVTDEHRHIAGLGRMHFTRDE